MKAKRDSEIQNTLDYLLSGDITRKQAAKRLERLCEDYYDSQIKTVNGLERSSDKCHIQNVSKRSELLIDFISIHKHGHDEKYIETLIEIAKSINCC